MLRVHSEGAGLNDAYRGCKVIVHYLIITFKHCMKSLENIASPCDKKNTLLFVKNNNNIFIKLK